MKLIILLLIILNSITCGRYDKYGRTNPCDQEANPSLTGCDAGVLDDSGLDGAVEDIFGDITTDTADDSGESYIQGSWQEFNGSASSKGVSMSSGQAKFQAIKVNLEGKVCIAWRYLENDYYYTYLKMWNGTTWSEIGGSATGNGISSNGCYDCRENLFLSLAFTADGSPAVAWVDNFENQDVIYLKGWVSVDNAWNEIGPSSASERGAFNSSTHHPVLIWKDYNHALIAYFKVWGNTHYFVHANHWLGPGRGWSEMADSSSEYGISPDSEGTAFNLAIATNSQDSLFVAWEEQPVFSNAAHVIFLKYLESQGAQWQELGENSGSGPGLSPSDKISRNPAIAINANGGPIIAYEVEEDTSSSLYIIQWNGSEWQEFAPGSAAGNGMTNSTSSYIPSIAVDNNGLLIVAWLEKTAGSAELGEIYVKKWDGLKWRELGNQSAQNGGISNSGGKAFRPVIAIDLEGNPVVSWIHQESTTTAYVFVKHFLPE